MTAMLDFELPERPRVAEDPTFLSFLRANADAGISVSAARLRKLDTPLVQLLLAAAAQWRARGLPFRLTGLPPDRVDQLRALGVTPDMLPLETAA